MMDLVQQQVIVIRVAKRVSYQMIIYYLSHLADDCTTWGDMIPRSCIFLLTCYIHCLSDFLNIADILLMFTLLFDCAVLVM